MHQQAFPEIFKHLQLFDGVSEHERNEFLRQGKIQYLPRKTYLFRQGDPVDYFYIVCSGSIQLLRNMPDGRSHTSDIVMQGKTICKMEIFKPSCGKQQTGALALEDSVVLWFPAQWLRNAARHHTVALNLIAAISQYSQILELEAEHKYTMTAPQQLACFLLRLGDLYGLDLRGFELPYSKSLIASRLGIEKETFSRCVTLIKNHGIEVHEANVVVHDSAQVEQYVCSHCSLNDECEARRKLMMVQSA